MSIELSVSVENQLRSLAASQGRDVRELAEEAVQQYLAAAAVNDVDPREVAETQTALLAELPEIKDWEADGPSNAERSGGLNCRRQSATDPS